MGVATNRETHFHANEDLIDAARDLLEAKNSREVIKKIAFRAHAALTKDTAAVYLEDGSGKMRAAAAAGIWAHELEGEVVEFGRGILGNLVAAGSSEIINDTSKDRRGVEVAGTPKTEEGEKLMGVSLRSHGRTVGIMAIWRGTKEPPFLEEDLAYLDGLSKLAVIALENARSYEEAQARLEHLSTLGEIGRTLASAHETEELLETVFREIGRIYDTTNFYIATYFEGASEYTYAIHTEHGKKLPCYKRDANVGLTGWVLRERKPLLMRNPEENRSFRERAGVVSIGEPSKSWMGVPLIAGNEITGVMALQNYDSPNLYGEQDLEFFSLIGTEVAVAIQNARLFEAARSARDEAEEANRMKSAFLAKMSHELRTPLNAIINFAYLLGLGSEGALSAGQAEMVKRVEDAGKHLLGLINDILDLAKIEAGRMELCPEESDLVDIVEETMGTASVLVSGKPVQLEFDPGPVRPIRVVVDRRRIRQVVLNLISNAAKFTDRGRIDVSIRMSPEAGTATVKVTDSGRGIAEKDIERIFEEFVQADDSHDTGGTGLGLPISRHFVEMHGGSIRASSELGKGSTFSFDLPLSAQTGDATANPAAAGTLAAMPVALAEACKDEARVLVIDDDDSSRAFLSKCLGKGNYRVVTLRDSRGSLQATRESMPDVIVLDVMMPDADGWSVLKTLRGDPETRGIPVVICSVMREERRAAFYDANDYMSKPLDPAELVSIVGKYAPRGGTVLAIDDDPDSLEIVRKILDPACVSVQTAANGIDGLASIRSNRPDAVVLDLMMPGMNGFEVLAELRADPATVDVPVVVVTAKDLTEEERKRLGENASALLQKGEFRPEDLGRIISRILSRTP